MNMTPAQRAVVAGAKKDGLPAMEVAAEFICHSLMEILLAQLRKREIAFNKLGEREQDAAIQEMQTELRKLSQSAARVITANGCETVAATMKSLKIDGKLTATMVIDGEEPNRHILTDKAHDKSGILIVLYPNDFSAGLGEFQGERDQKSLPLESDAKEKKPRATKAKATADVKPIELPPAQIEAAKDFVVKQQNATIPGLQNQLKINIDRAYALHVELERQGILTAPDDKGNRQLIRAEEPAAEIVESGGGSAEKPTAVETEGHDLETDADGFVIMSDELFARAADKVKKDGKVSQGALCITYDLDDNVGAQLMDRLELEGVISQEDELGNREVFGAEVDALSA